ncbi:MAG: DUF362 domain-containing protein [Candidatus Aminicenantes bacterium]|nr:DUF362 domain-containing protein [Candidatus Aminicenantes bacterium]
MKEIITRRDFIRGTSYAVLGTAIGLSAQRPKKSRVVLVRHPDAVDDDYAINAEVIQNMFDEGVVRLFDAKGPADAFQKIVKPGEIVGIKSNVWSYLPTPPELEQAIVKRLEDAGIKKENIGIDDHTVKTNPIFQNSTSLINVRPLRTHYLAGISGVMKNYIMFADSQPAYHSNSCANLGALFNLPMVKGKTRLNVLCVLTPQYHGRGPHHFSRRYVWNYKGLLFSQDPVAIDAIGLRLIMAMRTRKLGKERAVPPVPKHIEEADVKHGIGTSDINKIELIKLGWEEDILI